MSKNVSVDEIEEILILNRTNTRNDTNSRKSGNDGTEKTGTNSTSETESTTNAMEPDSVLCLLWHNNLLGGTYYKITDKQLYMLNDICDNEPEFLVTKSIFREVNPLYVITFGNTVNPFVKCLIECLNDDEETMNSDQPPSVPSNMSLLSYNDNLIDSSLHKILDINLPSAPKDRDNKQMYLNSLINYGNRRSTHALGVLIKFLEQYWMNFCPNDRELTIFHINQITLVNHVLMDKTVFKALQVFQSVSHKASFKRGSCDSTNQEGQSLYKLFSTYIKSTIGLLQLRNVLANPISNATELNNRLDFIDFALMSCNKGFMDSLRSMLKKLYDLQYILSVINRMKATRYNWENLYKTIIAVIQIHELCIPNRHKCNILMDLSTKITSNLYGLEKSINLALDFSETSKRKRPVIKFGLDSHLDAKKLKLQSIAKSVTTAAHFAVDHLPDYIDSCMVIHVPEMGYLVAIKEWQENCNGDVLLEYGFHFMFKFGGFLHYKNAMCKELDKLLGNLYDDIVAHENRIVHRLRGFVMKYNNDIREPLKIIAMIDCLQSMASIAKEKDFVRPLLNDDNVYSIENSWHPLIEEAFVSNDYNSGTAGRIKIITGPNASGKSIYLKQVATIIYLAHIGSFLPANKSSIGMLYSMHCRLHATESASLRMSAFMIDMKQMSQTLYNFKSNTLILMDEFGRGTAGSEGEVLHAAVLKHFIKSDKCPHILVATHYQNLLTRLPQSELIEYIKTNYTIEDNQLVFLYKISPGIATSFAFDVAESYGYYGDTLKRAKEMYDALRSNHNLKPIAGNIPIKYRQDVNDVETFLTDINISE